jgi:DNA-binding Lrp family transcriptional regulator
VLAYHIYRQKLKGKSGQLKLDETDLAILSELQADCTLSRRRLAAKLNVATSTINLRISKLVEHGVIKGFKAIIDPEKIGSTSTTFVMIQVNYQYLTNTDKTQLDVATNILKTTRNFPFITAIYTIAGEWDLLLTVRSQNLRETSEFIMKTLRKIKGVGKTCMYVVLETSLETTDVNIPERRDTA